MSISIPWAVSDMDASNHCAERSIHWRLCHKRHLGTLSPSWFREVYNTHRPTRINLTYESLVHFESTSTYLLLSRVRLEPQPQQIYALFFFLTIWVDLFRRWSLLVRECRGMIRIMVQNGRDLYRRQRCSTECGHNEHSMGEFDRQSNQHATLFNAASTSILWDAQRQHCSPVPAGDYSVMCSVIDDWWKPQAK
jgi:hypothetical protein